MFEKIEKREGTKGSKDVAYMVYDFLKKITDPQKDLIVFTDNCSGQNKNYTMIKFWYLVVKVFNFSKVLLTFSLYIAIPI